MKKSLLLLTATLLFASLTYAQTTTTCSPSCSSDDSCVAQGPFMDNVPASYVCQSLSASTPDAAIAVV